MTTATHSELELEAIRICQELIRIPSVNYGDGKGDEKDVAAHVVKLLSEVGIVSHTHPRRHIVRIRDAIRGRARD